MVLEEYLHRTRDSIAVLDQVVEYYPDRLEARAGRGVYLARIGEIAKARADAEDCLKRELSPFLLFQVAGIYARIWEKDRQDDTRNQALDLLRRSFRKGFDRLDLLKSDTELDPLRNDPEFRKIVRLAEDLRANSKR